MLGKRHQVDIANHWIDLYEPPGSAKPTYGLIFLHGVGQETLNSQPAFTKVLDELGIISISPHGGYSWWSDRICLEFDPGTSAEKHLLEHVLPFISERYGLVPPRLGLMGISMGGQGALRL